MMLSMHGGRRTSDDRPLRDVYRSFLDACRFPFFSGTYDSRSPGSACLRDSSVQWIHRVIFLSYVPSCRDVP